MIYYIKSFFLLHLLLISKLFLIAYELPILVDIIIIILFLLLQILSIINSNYYCALFLLSILFSNLLLLVYIEFSAIISFYYFLNYIYNCNNNYHYNCYS